MQIPKRDFCLEHTFECGQCFRWNQTQGGYSGVVGGRLISVTEQPDCFVTDCGDEQFITRYFDLGRDYAALKQQLCGLDEVLPEAVASGCGIRILRQDPWETLVSFIISANNNIPRIKGIIERLCMQFGEAREQDGVRYYAFPAPEALCGLRTEQLGGIRSGYRAQYILDAARKVADGTAPLGAIERMTAEEGRVCLKQILGVGDKVADCILLFAYGKFEVFPCDVWIRRVLERLYRIGNCDPALFAQQRFGALAGFAQQYLFYYGRTLL